MTQSIRSGEGALPDRRAPPNVLASHQAGEARPS
jgi:hypothetical protein